MLKSNAKDLIRVEQVQSTISRASQGLKIEFNTQSLFVSFIFEPIKRKEEDKLEAVNL